MSDTRRNDGNGSGNGNAAATTTTPGAGPWNGSGKRIHMQEVGTRDGLQVETQFVPTEDKIALVTALSDCGMA